MDITFGTKLKIAIFCLVAVSSTSEVFGEGSWRKLFRNNCETLHSPSGCYQAGMDQLAPWDKNDSENLILAIDYFRKACYLYEPKDELDIKEKNAACVQLGEIYEGRASYFDAKLAYQKACDSKYALGCLRLGELYSQGLGVRQNKRTAYEYYAKACDYGGLVCELFRN